MFNHNDNDSYQTCNNLNCYENHFILVPDDASLLAESVQPPLTPIQVKDHIAKVVSADTIAQKYVKRINEAVQTEAGINELLTTGVLSIPVDDDYNHDVACRTHHLFVLGGWSPRSIAIGDSNTHDNHATAYVSINLAINQ